MDYLIESQGGPYCPESGALSPSYFWVSGAPGSTVLFWRVGWVSHVQVQDGLLVIMCIYSN